MRHWQAVRDSSFEPHALEELNTVVVEIDEAGNKTVVARAGTAEYARRIAAALFNCGFEPAVSEEER